MEKTETAAANTAAQDKKKSAREAFAGYFTGTRIAYIAIFTAFSYALRFWEIPILQGTPVSFLKVDFSNIFPLIGGYALGPVAGVTIGVLKEALWMFFSTTMGVGELANILVMLPFVLIPCIAYKYKKGIASVIIFLAIGCVAQVVWSFPVNLFLNFPVFLGFNWQDGMNFFLGVWYWVILFNVIKAVIIAVIVLIIYKPISNLIKLTAVKFGAKGKKSPVEAEGRKKED